MTPGRDAVCFINHHHTDAHFEHVRLPIGIIQAFRCNKQYFAVTRYRLCQRCSILFWGKIRTHDGGWDVIDSVAALILIAHQRLERREDDGEVRKVEASHLVTERFSPASTLNDEQAFTLDELLDDITLPGMKACGDVKALSQECFGGIALPRNRRCHTNPFWVPSCLQAEGGSSSAQRRTVLRVPVPVGSLEHATILLSHIGNFACCGGDG